MKDNFVRQHPYITTTAALGVGLLAPIGIGMLAQQSTTRREDHQAEGQEQEAAPADGSVAPEFIYRHPYITAGAALGALLLAPAGLNLFRQAQASWSGQSTAGDSGSARGRGGNGATSITDFIHEHPLMTTTAALGVGLLAPIGVSMLAQQSTAWREGFDPVTAADSAAAEPGHDGFDEDFMARHPYITTGLVAGGLLLTPAGQALLEQLPGWGSGDGGRSSETDGQDFVHQHPFMTAGAALAVGLLAPLGVSMLAQQSTAWRDGLDLETARAKPAAKSGPGAGGFGLEDFYQHPLVGNAVALGALLMSPAGKELLAQLGASMSGNAADDERAAPRQPTGEREPAEDDFIHQHPFMTAAVAFVVGLLAPFGLDLAEQLQEGRAGIAQAGKQALAAAQAKAERAAARSGSAATSGGDTNGSDDSAERQRAFIANAAAAGGAALGALTMLSRSLRAPDADTGTVADVVRPDGPVGTPQPDRAKTRVKKDGRPRDVGALDMQFMTQRPGGKDVHFSFGWKKRPVEMSETDWPIDNMGFKVDRPDGKHVEFSMARKSRPIPDGYGGAIRPGLGQATLEFVSRRPDSGAFRFTWEKIPPAAAAEREDRPAEPPTSDANESAAPESAENETPQEPPAE